MLLLTAGPVAVLGTGWVQRAAQWLVLLAVVWVPFDLVTW